jgi:hypothetical protein
MSCNAFSARRETADTNAAGAGLRPLALEVQVLRRDPLSGQPSGLERQAGGPLKPQSREPPRSFPLDVNSGKSNGVQWPFRMISGIANLRVETKKVENPSTYLILLALPTGVEPVFSD